MRYIWILILLPFLGFSQQIADESYNPPIPSPEYEENEGSVVFIDEGHYNFHTKEGRYKAFSNLLSRDGYQVKAFKGAFTRSKLQKGDILVISNALNKVNRKKWVLPTPSAFTKEEIQAVKDWVQSGGSLFLIADHMPMGGSAEDLAMAFGFEFTNGFVFDTTKQGNDNQLAQFTLANGLLMENMITTGRSEDEFVTEVMSFTGQAFKIPEKATPILLFDENYLNILPVKAWDFREDTPRQSADGWYQGAYMEYGNGRVVMFGEAAMFSAQWRGKDKMPMGMNNPNARQNYQLLLNIIHWLDGRIPLPD